MVSFLRKNILRPVGRLFKSPSNFATGLRKGLNTIRDIAGIAAPALGPLAPLAMEASIGAGMAGRTAGKVAQFAKKPSIERAIAVKKDVEGQYM